MDAIGKATTAFWLLALGWVGFYVYFVVIGFFSPGEVVALGIGTAAFAVACVVHAVRVRRAMRDHGHSAHEQMMRALHREREVRGF
jgi:hypothetical protein